MRSRISISKVACAILAALCVVILVNCSDDPVSSPPSGTPDYHVYYFYTGGEIANRYIMPIYSTKSRTQVDSIVFQSLNPTTFVFSPDGRYRAAMRAPDFVPVIIVQDLATDDTIAVTPDLFVDGQLLVSFDSRYLASRGLYYSNAYYGGAAVYSLPQLEMLWIDTAEDVTSAAFLGQAGKVIYARAGVDSFFVVDLLSQPPVRQAYRAWPGSNPSSHYYPATMAVDPVNNLLYTGGNYGTVRSSEIRIYEVGDFSLFQSLYPVPWGATASPFVISRDGRYAYKAAWNRDTTFQSIYRYDVINRFFEEFISGEAIYTPELLVRDMQITPDGKTLCVVVSPPDLFPIPGNTDPRQQGRSSLNPSDLNPGSLMMIDTDSRRVVAVFDRSTSGRAKFCRVYPVAQ